MVYLKDDPLKAAVIRRGRVTRFCFWVEIKSNVQLRAEFGSRYVSENLEEQRVTPAAYGRLPQPRNVVRPC